MANLPHLTQQTCCYTGLMLNLLRISLKHRACELRFSVTVRTCCIYLSVVLIGNSGVQYLPECSISHHPIVRLISISIIALRHTVRSYPYIIPHFIKFWIANILHPNSIISLMNAGSCRYGTASTI